MPATAETESALEMDWAKRREVQARLTLDGADVGRADGAFGPKTRGGLRAWQETQGLTPTGYFNAPQLQLLMARTQEALPVWLEENPVERPSVRSAPVRVRTSAPKRKPTTALDQHLRGPAQVLDNAAAFLNRVFR